MTDKLKSLSLKDSAPLPKRPFGRVVWEGDIFGSVRDESELCSLGVRMGEWDQRRRCWRGCEMRNDVKEKVDILRRQGRIRWQISIKPR